VNSVALVALLHLSMLGADTDKYADAHRETAETGKPMMVMVTTTWCGPCQTMKRNVIPKLRENGSLEKVAFAIVDQDQERKLAKKLTGGGPIPQLVMYRKTTDGWRRAKLVGGQSVSSVERFIDRAVAATELEAEKQAADAESIAKTVSHTRYSDND
jgi:thioredoxin-like negative regulator of GroEL